MNLDDALSDLLAPGPAANLSTILDRMLAIEALLPDDDGLKWFDLLYRMVTEGIVADLDTTPWADRAWLTDLAVVFANFYFDAVYRWLTTRPTTPRAWKPFFDARSRRGIAEAQYALAGMNAHINRDLPVAVVKVCQDRGVAPVSGSPQHQDYERINDILARVEKTAIEVIARGAIGVIARSLGTLDDVLAMWSVRRAREAAWTHAQVLWALRDTPTLADDFLTVLDRKVGFAGSGLLVRTCPL
jgi:hypothetical protein